MKVGIIDIGSNSVRILLADGKIKKDKISAVTKLSEGLQSSGKLSEKAIERTVGKLDEFKSIADGFGAEKIYAFGTEALRKAQNADIFVKLLYSKTGISVEIISGEREAELGFKGALDGNGGLIDLGGASAEITVKEGENRYSKSLPVGIVRVKDFSGGDPKSAEEFSANIVKDFVGVPKTDKWVAIGGTVTQLAAIDLSLEVYDPLKVQGHIFTYSKICFLCDMLSNLSAEEIKKLKGVSPMRADTVCGGAIVIKNIMRQVGIEKFTVSENDNLEGFLKEIN